MKKYIYTWHRNLSLIIAAPLVLWAASGFMHPIMTTIRPQVATQWLMPKAIDSNKIKVSLQQALLQNHIDSFTNFRLVHIDTNWFYQVQQGRQKEPFYISTHNGKLLPQGQWLYAQYLAKQFLEGMGKPDTAHAIAQAPSTASAHDCCDAATTCVLNNTKGSKVRDVSTITAFNEEYKSVNKLLPVQRVSFDRVDGIRVYVETTQDRFAFAMDNKRAVFDKVFTLFHTWSWLNFLGKGKLIVEILLTALALITSLMGLYIFFITKSKKAKGNTTVRARNNHRYVSVAISLFTLMFTFSGCYHAFAKLKADDRSSFYDEHWFTTAHTNFDIEKLQAAVQAPITNTSMVSINNQTYWQVNTRQQNKQQASKDLMKTKEVPAPAAMYINANNYSILPQGQTRYAEYLATQFSKHTTADIQRVQAITKFGDEYGFINKRLPVFKVSYATNSNERYYVETASGKLALRVNDKDVLEGYSFALLHKHEFMAWAGKPIKDFSTMFWAMAQIAMVAIGLILYLKMRKKKLQHHQKNIA